MSPALSAAEDVNQLKQQRGTLTQQMRQLDLLKSRATKVVKAAQKSLASLKSKHAAVKRERDKLTPKAKLAISQRTKLQQQLKQSRQKLAAVGEKIELQQSADSPLVKEKVEFAVNLDRYTSLVDQIKRSDDFRQRLEQLQSTGAASAKIAGLHKTFIKENPTVQKAFYAQKSSRDKYEQGRRELLEKHPEWKKANDGVEYAEYLHKTAERAADAAAKLQAAAATKEHSALAKVKSQTRRVTAAQASVKRLDAARAYLKRQIDALNKRIGKR